MDSQWNTRTIAISDPDLIPAFPINTKTMDGKVTFENLLEMNKEQVAEVFWRGHPLDLDQLDNSHYLGVDLGMPSWFHKFFWKTFRKTFYYDAELQVLRGWNVKLEQTGWDNPLIAKKNKEGEDFSFAHYVVESAKGKQFPKNWSGDYFLNYSSLNNNFGENLAYTPLVAVNEGDMDLLIGWEIFKIGSLFIPLNDHWVLKREGPLQQIVEAP